MQDKSTVKSHDLLDFIIAVTQEMAREYERIQKRVTEDPGTAGDQGEENWATLLRNWLPPTYQIVTKGRILGHQGSASPQIDILVLSPMYPRHLLDKKLYLAGGVVAAFECKLTLRPGHIKKAFENAAQIRRLVEPRTGTPYRELNSPIIYGLLAHSHSWHSQRPESRATMHVAGELNSWRSAGVIHPREMLDLICIADLATYTVSKLAYHPSVAQTTGAQGPIGVGYFQWIPPKRWPHQPPDYANNPNIEPIGTMLCALLYKMAWEDRDLRRLAEYFLLTDIQGAGAGGYDGWPLSLYSEEVKNRIVTYKTSDFNDWDEWVGSIRF